MKTNKINKVLFLLVTFSILSFTVLNGNTSYAASCSLNHVIDTGEACDDGNTRTADGCSLSCTVESGWTCTSTRNTLPLTGSYSVCSRIPICPNGIKESGEGCDDGNATSGDGCSSTCQIEPDLCSNIAGAQYTVPSGYVLSGSICSRCGDSKTEGIEMCDDGNQIEGDGCLKCEIESGWSCSGDPSICSTTCGDGIIAGNEDCDDGNTDPYDGCDNCKERMFLGPTEAPPQANVTPTFTGLVVDGSALFTNATVENDFTVTGRLNRNDPLILGSTGAVPAGLAAGDIYTSGNLNVGNIKATGNLVFQGASPYINSTTSDTINISSILNIQNGITNSTVDEGIQINDDLFVDGAIKDPNSALKINSVIDVLWYLYSSVGALLIQDDLIIQGSITDSDSDVTIGENLVVNGNIKLGGTSTNFGNYYYIEKDFTVDGLMKYTTAPEYNPGEQGYGVKCAVGDYVVSCLAGSRLIEPNDRFLGTESADYRTCSGRADDEIDAGDTDTLRVRAICFDPQGATSHTCQYLRYNAALTTAIKWEWIDEFCFNL